MHRNGPAVDVLRTTGSSIQTEEDSHAVRALLEVHGVPLCPSPSRVYFQTLRDWVW